MRKCHTVHSALLEHLALLVLHHVDEAVFLELLDESLDQPTLTRSTSAVDVGSAILDDRVGHFVLKRVVRAPANLLGLVHELPRTLSLKGAIR